MCAASDEKLEPGATCIACLCEREADEGFDRFDYSLAAWEAGERPQRLFSYWRLVVPEPDQKRHVFIDDSVLMDLLERLATDERPQRIAFRFVLGLILLRKRLLKFDGRIERHEAGEEREYWLMRPKGSDAEQPPIELLNPRLSDDDVRELTAQLSEVFQSEL